MDHPFFERSTIMFSRKIYDLNSPKELYMMMKDHQEEIWRANREPEDSPYRALQRARDEIMMAYYERQEAIANAKKRAQEDAELEAEARENYEIRFTSDLKGGSK